MENRIEYRPSFVARTARVAIPLLQRILPSSLYISVYEKLYSSYKTYLKTIYVVESRVCSIFWSERTNLKKRLTMDLLPFSMGGHKSLENAFETVEIIEDNAVPGALVECGVAEGGASAMLALASRKIGGGERSLWLFDSYEGLPEPSAEDYLNGKTGEFIRPLPKGACLGTVEQVKNLMFGKLKLREDKVFLVKGWFQDTIAINVEKIGSIAVLRLDGDWYESTKIPLENLYPIVSKGGAIIIDDYATCYGSRLATDEFLKNNGIVANLNPDGRGGVWFLKK